MIRYTLYRWSWAALDWLFPPTCGGCEAPGARWCPECQESTARIEFPYCQYCGQPVSGRNYCERCIDSPPKLTAIRSWAIFDGPVRNALHRVKYRRDVALAEALMRPVIDYVIGLGWQVSVVAPVPLSKKRLGERGYNQADLLAKPLALGMGLSYQTKALQRGRETRSQVDLNLVQRRENVKDAFSAKGKLIDGKAVLIVDDVATSGSTLDACAEALWQAGASDVYGVTLARAVLTSN